MHLCLALEALQVGNKVAMVGTDRPPQRVVIRKRSIETKWQERRLFKTVGDHASVILLALLIDACRIFLRVLRNQNGEVARRKEEYLISKEALYVLQRHRTTMT